MAASEEPRPCAALISLAHFLLRFSLIHSLCQSQPCIHHSGGALNLTGLTDTVLEELMELLLQIQTLEFYIAFIDLRGKLYALVVK